MQSLKRNLYIDLFGLGLLAWMFVDLPFRMAFHQRMGLEEKCAIALLSVFSLLDLMIHRKKENGLSLISLVSALPFDLIGISLTSRAAALSVLILPKAFRIPALCRRIKEKAELVWLSKRSKIGAIVIISLLAIHFIACGWILINGVKSKEVLTEYNKAVYWAITTLTTIGYGDITPSTNWGRVYTMVIMILGVGVYGLVISQMSLLVLSSDKREETNKRKLEHLADLLRHYDIPRDLQKRVFAFYRHMISHNVHEEEEKILAELPNALKQQIEVFMNLKPLSKIAFFANCSKQCLHDVAQRLTKVFFAPGEKILTKGDIGREMYIIGHGRVEIHDGNTSIAALGEGQCFGEMALLGEELRRADVTAKSYCDVGVLTKEQLEELMQKHPDLKNNVERIHRERMRSTAA
ncbi:MAG: cyclic nucleotide-binding domain-containing protein [Oligoflexales bacterium]